MKNKYITFLHQYYDNQAANILQVLLSNGFVDDIQQLLNKEYNAGLVVDGVLGMKTLNAMIKVPAEILLTDLVKMVDVLPVTPKDGESVFESLIMNYLSSAEGINIHWNKGENDLTTPYGIYGYAFPKADVVLYVKSLCRKYGYNPTTRNYTALKHVNASLTREERLRIRHEAWIFYKENFMHPAIKETMLKRRAKKSFLSHFSLSVNSGMRRGIKMLQRAIGVRPDGKAGRQTIAILDKKLITDGDEVVNQKMLCAMLAFYHRLVQRSRAKFGRFLNGWKNRLKGLGLKRC